MDKIKCKTKYCIVRCKEWNIFYNSNYINLCINDIIWKNNILVNSSPTVAFLVKNRNMLKKFINNLLILSNVPNFLSDNPIQVYHMIKNLEQKQIPKYDKPSNNRNKNSHNAHKEFWISRCWKYWHMLHSIMSLS